MHRTATFFLSSFLCSTLLVSLASTPRAHAGPVEAPVVGGTSAKLGAYPDVVAVLGADGSLCTGTLLTSDLVLTAGHCIEGDPIEIIVGSVELAKPGGDRRRVKWAKAYPDWEHTYDVGIVMLENPVSAKPRAVAQACGSPDRFKPGLPLQLVGFGLTTQAGTGDNTRLHQAAIPLVDATCTSDPTCNPSVAPGGEFTAGGRGTDACFGDSGGPVYIETAKGAALIGVVSRGLASWSEPCAAGGVYVRADKVVPWIERTSGRKLERVACDQPADDAGTPDDAGGCNAAGASGAAGALQGGFALYYAALVVLGLRRRRTRAAQS